MQPIAELIRDAGRLRTAIRTLKNAKATPEQVRSELRKLLPPPPVTKPQNAFAVLVNRWRDQAQKMGCLMVMLPQSASDQITAWAAENIPADALAADGFEARPHVTVQWGFKPEFDVQRVTDAFAGDVDIELGPLQRFTNGTSHGHDVLYFPVVNRGPSLLRHKVAMLADSSHIAPQDYKYNPHVTVAYVKPGALRELDGSAPPVETMLAHRIEYSAADGSKQVFDSQPQPQVLPNGGPGSGCNPEKGKCGRKAGAKQLPYNDWIKSLSNEEQQVIRLWTDNAYVGIRKFQKELNKAKASGAENPAAVAAGKMRNGELFARASEILQEALDRAEPYCCGKLYRGVVFSTDNNRKGGGAAEAEMFKPGARFSLPAMSSATTEPNVAERFALASVFDPNPARVIFEFEGVRNGVQLGHQVSQHLMESEVVLRENTSYRVKSVKQTENMLGEKFTMVTVEPDEHVNNSAGLAALAEDGGEAPISRFVDHGLDYIEFEDGRVSNASHRVKRRASYAGMNVNVEHEAGDIREGQDKGGKDWSVVMPCPYGYLRGTTGADGDAVDVYLANDPEPQAPVYVIHQVDPATKEPDEHKAMLGFQGEQHARNTYQQAFSDGSGASRIGSVETMSQPEFKDWIRKEMSNRGFKDDRILNYDENQPRAEDGKWTSLGHSAAEEFYDKGHAWIKKAKEAVSKPFKHEEKEKPKAKSGQGWLHDTWPDYSKPLSKTSEPPPKWRSAGAVVHNDEGKIAIIRPAGGFGGREWTFPKGRIDAGETKEQAAHREVGEETGLTGELGAHLGEHPGAMSVTDFYLMKHTGTGAKMDKETEELKWVTPEEAAEHLDSVRDLRVLVKAVAAMAKQNKTKVANSVVPAEETLNNSDNCGTGHGGFQPGNTCAKGDGTGPTKIHDTSNWPPENSAAKWGAKKIALMQKLHDEGNLAELLKIDSVPKSASPNKYQKGVHSAWKTAVDSLQKQGITSATPPAPQPQPDVVVPKAELPSVAGWKQIEGQKGSNPGGVYENPEGDKYYVKFSQSDAHARNEMLGAALYQLAGTPTTDYSLGKNSDGKLVTLTKWEPTLQPYKGTAAGNMEASKNFATHAWLANWDAVGASKDNLKWRVKDDGSGKQLVTVDTGGALEYRAMGGKKDFGNEAHEWDNMRNPAVASQAASVFGGMTPQQLVDSAAKVTKITDAQIADTVKKYVPGEAKQKELTEKLIARRDDIAKQADKLSNAMAQPKPEAPVEPPKPAEPAKPAAAAPEQAKTKPGDFISEDLKPLKAGNAMMAGLIYQKALEGKSALATYKPTSPFEATFKQKLWDELDNGKTLPKGHIPLPDDTGDEQDKGAKKVLWAAANFDSGEATKALLGANISSNYNEYKQKVKDAENYKKFLDSEQNASKESAPAAAKEFNSDAIPKNSNMTAKLGLMYVTAAQKGLDALNKLATFTPTTTTAKNLLVDALKNGAAFKSKVPLPPKANSDTEFTQMANAFGAVAFAQNPKPAASPAILNAIKSESPTVHEYGVTLHNLAYPENQIKANSATTPAAPAPVAPPEPVKPEPAKPQAKDPGSPGAPTAPHVPPPPVINSVANKSAQKKLDEIYEAAKTGDIEKVKGVYTNETSQQTYSKKAHQYKQAVLAAMQSGGKVSEDVLKADKALEDYQKTTGGEHGKWKPVVHENLLPPQPNIVKPVDVADPKFETSKLDVKAANEDALAKLKSLAKAGDWKTFVTPGDAKVIESLQKSPKLKAWYNEVLSSQYYDTNLKAVDALKTMALKGDLTGIKSFANFKSPAIEQYKEQLAANVKEQLTPPPPPPKVFDGGFNDLQTESVKPIPHSQVPKAEKVLKFVAIGNPGVSTEYASKKALFGLHKNLTAKDEAKGAEAVNAMSSIEKHGLASYTGAGYGSDNAHLKAGHFSDEQAKALGNAIVKKAPILPEGSFLSRNMHVDENDIKKFLASNIGHVIQEAAFSSTSATNNKYRPDANFKMKLVTAKGVRGLYAGKKSSIDHEDEVLLPPNTRYWIQHAYKSENGDYIIHAVVLPTEQNQCC